MSNLIKQLSNNYLTNFISVEDFRNIINTYNTISERGLLERSISEKEIISMYFQNSISEDFFEKQTNLQSFLSSVPEKTQKMISQDLDCPIDSIKWNDKVSSYFINKHGISDKFKPSTTPSNKNITSIIDYNSSENRFKKLKFFQANIAYDLFEYLYSTPFARAILQMPTGSGKTRTSIEIACDFLNKTSKSIVWLANTEELCNQAFYAFDEIWSFIGNKRLTLINHQLNKKKFNSSNQTFHVVSIQSLIKETNFEKYGINPEEIGLVIVDEAHISIAPKFKQVINKLISHDAKLLGLTATPGRNTNYNPNDEFNEDYNKWSENKKLSDFYFNKVFKLNVKGQNPIEYLRSIEVLSLAQFIPLEGIHIEGIIKSSDMEKSEIEKKIPKEIEKILTNDSERNAMIFEQLVDILSSGKKVIFFGTSVRHSKMICTLLKTEGFKAAHIDGNSGTHRKTIINQFKKNKIQILCNYGVLSTGFDDPKIDVVFMARPTNSIVLYSQIIGRGLRGPAVGGTKSCEIYTVMDNIVDLPNNKDIFDYFDGYFL